MRYPEFLKENGKIAYVAPSCGCATEPYVSGFNNALKKWEALGYENILGPNCYMDKGIGISNVPSECAKELMEYYASPDNDVIISCGGGELMCETISEVDFDIIKSAKPKWYMGYSDNTNMSFLLNTLCDVAAIYGPCAAAFGMEPRHKCIEDAYEMLIGKKLVSTNYDMYEIESLKDEEHPLATYNCTEPVDIKGYFDGEYRNHISMEGRLTGGCLDVLVNIVGTRFDKVSDFLEKYKEDGIIWFLEACDLNVFSIRRALWQLKEAGWFKYTKGFIFGRPRIGYEEIFNLDRFEAVLQVAGRELNVPIIFDADIGHIPPAMPIISGALSKVSFDDGNLVIDMGIEI